jgi:Flp pilus assembly protein TadG
MKSKSRFLSLLSRLGKHKHASGPRLLARLLRDERGSYLLYITLLIPVVIGVSGLSTEGGLIFYNHRTLQSAADAAAYSAAVAYSLDADASKAQTQAEAIFANYGFVVGTGNDQANVTATVDTTTYSPLTAINVTATRPQMPILSSLFLNAAIPVGGNAIAVIDSSNGGNCMIALGNSSLGPPPISNANPAIQIQGGGGPAVNINLVGCGVFSNSSASCSNNPHDGSIVLSGSARMSAGSVGAAGCVTTSGAAAIGPPNTYTQGDGILSDPYAQIPIPSSGSTPAPCVDPTYPDSNPDPITHLTPLTLPPGRYCSLNTESHPSSGGGLVDYAVKLSGGVYVFDSQQTGNTTVVVKNGSLVSDPNGPGVTLEFTSSVNRYPNKMFDVLANGSVSLTAENSVPTAGFVLMGDRNMPLGTIFDTSSNPNVFFDGTVYLPNGALTWGGNANTGLNCLQLIANTVILTGDTTLTAAGCTLTGGQKPIGSIVTLVD